jgi:hypothetical protein
MSGTPMPGPGVRPGAGALLVAVTTQDWDRAEEVVAAMTPGEKKMLQVQLMDVASILLYGYVPPAMKAASAR